VVGAAVSSGRKFFQKYSYNYIYFQKKNIIILKKIFEIYSSLKKNFDFSPSIQYLTPPLLIQSESIISRNPPTKSLKLVSNQSLLCPYQLGANLRYYVFLVFFLRKEKKKSVLGKSLLRSDGNSGIKQQRALAYKI
jgi:hypothetical protein